MMIEMLLVRVRGETYSECALMRLMYADSKSPSAYLR
jgi:hypothetical protein